MKKLSLFVGDWCRQTLNLSEEKYHIVLYGLEVMLGAMFVVCFSPVQCAQMNIRIAQILWIPMLIYSIYQFIKRAPRNSKVNPIYDARILKRKRIGSMVANFLVIAIVIIFCNYNFCWILVNSLFAEAVLISAAVVDGR